MFIVFTMIRTAVTVVKSIRGRKFRKRLISNTLTKPMKLHKDFN